MTDDYHQSTWALARLAECGSPDRDDGTALSFETADPVPSPGAIFLRSVEDGARELYDSLRADYDDDPDDWAEHVERWADYHGGVHEIADGAPSLYTHERWQEYADLAAWQEDPAEYGDPGSMTASAGICLFLIAERLVWALLREWAEADAETDDDALDVWLRIPEGEEEAEAEANTYATPTGYRVDWSLTAVGLVTSVHFGTLPEAHTWLEAEGFADFTVAEA